MDTNLIGPSLQPRRLGSEGIAVAMIMKPRRYDDQRGGLHSTILTSVIGDLPMACISSCMLKSMRHCFKSLFFLQLLSSSTSSSCAGTSYRLQEQHKIENVSLLYHARPRSDKISRKLRGDRISRTCMCTSLGSDLDLSL